MRSWVVWLVSMIAAAGGGALFVAAIPQREIPSSHTVKAVTIFKSPRRLQADPGKRFVSIVAGTHSGAAPPVVPGDFVDILLTRPINGRPVATVIVQDVTVLAIRPQTGPRPAPPGPAKSMVVLEATIVQAQKLALAQRLGELSVVVRVDAGPRRPRPWARGWSYSDDEAAEALRRCDRQAGAPRPRWLLYPDGPSGRGGRGVCSRKLPGVDERPIIGPLQRSGPLIAVER